jgi:ribosome-binding factor A
VLGHAFAGTPLRAAKQDHDVSQRTERVDELLRQEIGSIISKDVADPRVGFVTITEVETTPDLRHAKVWVSVIGQPAERDAAVAALRHAMPFIRHELGQRLRIKRIPDLHVHVDDTAERGTRILQLLSDLDAGGNPDPDAAVTEALPTPVPRIHRADDLAVEPPSAVRQPVGGRPRSRRTGHRSTPHTGSSKTPRKGSR